MSVGLFILSSVVCVCVMVPQVPRVSVSLALIACFLSSSTPVPHSVPSLPCSDSDGAIFAPITGLTDGQECLTRDEVLRAGLCRSAESVIPAMRGVEEGVASTRPCSRSVARSGQEYEEFDEDQSGAVLYSPAIRFPSLSWRTVEPGSCSCCRCCCM